MRSLRMAPFPVLLLLLASCGGPASEPAEALPLAAEPAQENGIILGLRPLAASPGGEARRQLVSQVVGAARGAGTPDRPGAVEVMVRLERGGRDVALIEPAGSWMQPGERVRLTPGARPGLVAAPGAGR